MQLCSCDQTSQLIPRLICAPDTNSSSAVVDVAVATGMVSPARGSLEIVRVENGIDVIATTRLTGPISCTRLLM